MSDRQDISPVRQRVIVAAFVLVLAGAGLLNSVVKRHDLANTEGQNAAVSAVVLNARATSAAWYCPGPLALGHRGERSAISITNVSTRQLNAEVHVATNSGGATNTSVVLTPRHEAVIALVQPKHPTYGAVTVVVNGPGVGVNEIVRTAAGIVTSPCTTHTSDRAYFAVGSTLGSSNMAISLFNPGATPAVASLSFTAGSTVISPAAFTSVPVEPGQVVVLFAGHALPQRNVFSAEVSTISGQISVGALSLRTVNSILSSTLRVGLPIAQSSWWFAPTVVAPALHQVFAISNPTTRRETVDLRLVGTGATGTVTFVVGAGSTVLYAAPASRLTGVQAASVSVRGSGSLVAEREIVLARRLSAGRTEPGADLPSALPAGFAITQANAARASAWLLAGGRSDGAASEVVAVANPGVDPVTVTIDQIVNGGRSPIPGVGSLVIAPHGSGSIDLSKRIDGRSAIALEVRATRQVIAGLSEYGRSSQGLSVPAPLPER